MLWKCLRSLAVLMSGLLLASALALATSLEAKAQPALSPAMIQELKSLPPAQARALAQQYGVDLEAYLPQETPSPLGQAVVMPATPPPVPAAPGAVQSEGEAREDAQSSTLIEALDPRERFGLSFFRAEVASFAPVDSAPVPPDYRLGPGDSLEVLLLGAQSAELDLTVDRFGEIALPEIGKVGVAGLRFDDAAALLRAKIGEARIGIEAYVSLGRLRAINVMLAGEVAVPGARALAGMARLSHALYAAGGITDLGSLRAIEVKRAGETVARFDSYDLLLRGDARHDVALRDGDVVFVPPVAQMAGVGGAVRRPGVYEISGEESLAELIAMAGGATERSLGEVLVEREGPSGLPEIFRFAEAGLEAVPAEGGDRLRVQLASNRFANRVRLRGAVQRPGVYGFEAGMTLSDLVPSIEGALLEDTDLAYGLILSKDRASGRLSVRQFSPERQLTGDLETPLTLAPLDEVLFFPRPNASAEAEADERRRLIDEVVARLRLQASPELPAQITTIEGAVHSPGAYPLQVGFSAADLLAAAGGLRDDAYLRQLEILRPTVSERGDVSLVSRLVSAESEEGLARVLLEGRDRVVVRSLPNWDPQRRVTLEGEFRFPGSYLLLPGESLGELVERVGGLTGEAFPYGAVFSAAAAAEREREETQQFVNDIRRSYASQALTQEQQAASFTELEEAIAGLLARDSLGRVAIDLPRILAGDGGADVVLADGDRLYVPGRQDTVTVLGEVYRPGSFRFEEGLGLQGYLALGAGTTPRAAERNLYIVRANGRVDRPEVDLLRFQLADAALRPGDTVVVPVDASHRDPLDFWTSITQVAYQTGIAVAAVLRN